MLSIRRRVGIQRRQDRIRGMRRRRRREEEALFGLRESEVKRGKEIKQRETEEL